MRKFGVWLLLFIGLFGIGYWFYWKLSRPLPGEAVPDLGRDHVADIAGVDYNSNPPTSGPHFPVWAKSGVYGRLLSDGYLIHSLEHGYIILSYDCTKAITTAKPVTHFQFSIFNALAHDEPTQESTDSGQLLKHMKIQPAPTMSWFTPKNPPEVEVSLPESFDSGSCKNLVSQLLEFTKAAERIIVVPRVGLDTPIVLTAWNRILKLDNADKKTIGDFIKAFHNRGPEQTDE